MSSEECLLELWLQKKVLRKEENGDNGEFWGVQVDPKGKVARSFK